MESIAFEPLLIEPDDDTLTGLNAAIVEAPDDESLLLVKADRLDELDRPALAIAIRLTVKFQQFRRECWYYICASCGVPAHILCGEPAPSLNEKSNG